MITLQPKRSLFFHLFKMKYFISFLGLLISFHLSSQDTQVLELQEFFENSSGKESFEVGYQLFEAFYEMEAFEEAIDIAKLLKEKANDLDLSAEEAIALNLEAKALLELDEKKLRNRTKALQRIKRSQRIMRRKDIENKRLFRSNKELLGRITGSNNMREWKDVQKLIDKAVDSVKVSVGEINNSINAEKYFEEDFLKKPRKENPKLKESFRRMEKKKEEMVIRILEENSKNIELQLDALDNIEIHPVGLDSLSLSSLEKLDSLDVFIGQKKEQIKKKLVKKATTIEQMNKEEAKEELLLAQYRSMYDSLAHLRALDSINLVNQEIEIKQKETELAQEKSQRALSLLGIIGSLLLLTLMLFGYFQQRKNNRLLSEKNSEIQEEQNRSNDLLLNILPAKVADELKQYGSAQAQKYEDVSVLFTDFENFSYIAEQLSAEQLVSELDYCFKAFDQIIDKYGLEKIKTIGDAYMCAGGLPTPNADNAKLAVQAAFEIQIFLEDWKAQKNLKQEPYFQARIGIHTGPIVAGVVGSKKFAYDIWGDTVNVAARMESGGEAGKINISGTTFELIKNDFECTYRGKVSAKNKGDIEMYFVEREGATV